MNLIFKEGSLLEKLEKCRILDNMRSEITKKILEGVEFSNESAIALSHFKESNVETFFVLNIKEDKIYKTIDVFAAAQNIYSNAGYSTTTFHPSRYYNLEDFTGEELVEKTAEQVLKKDWVYYYISQRELDKIGWTDPQNSPAFVTEVFTKLDCMPDEITE